MEMSLADYFITDHIHIGGSHFALGYNPNATAPFAVWQTNEYLTEFQWPRYFAHKHAAIADMVLRSTYQLQQPDGTPLSVDFLAENARENLQMQFIHEAATEKIQEQLSDILLEFDTELRAEQIMQNQEFQDKACDSYYNIDRSDEDFVLRQTLRDMLHDHPHFLHSDPQKTSLDGQIHAARKKQTNTSTERIHAPEIDR